MKQCDLLGRGPNGELVVLEVAGNPDHEVHNALHAVRHGAARLWVICLSTKIRDEVKRRFREHLELGGSERVRVITLSEALSEKWLP